MQQTKNHKLKLIEMSDTFSTGPLNENMETIDAALKAASDTTSAISQRVGTLEAKHIAIGTYRGQESAFSINVGFAPKAVFIGGNASTLIVGAIADGMGGSLASLTSTGFTVKGGSSTYGVNNKNYNYVAID